MTKKHPGRPSDQEARRVVDHLRHRASTLWNDLQIVAEAPDSQSMRDRAALGDLSGWEAVTMATGSGLDHLRSLLHLLSSGYLPVTAGYSMLRGAVEMGSVAFWILHEPSDRERRVRVLRWWGENISGAHMSGMTLDTKSQDLAPIKSAAQAIGHVGKPKVEDGYGYKYVVDYTARNATFAGGLPAGQLGELWCVCSAFAHGLPWPLAAQVTHTWHLEEVGGVPINRLTMDWVKLADLTAYALALLELDVRMLKTYAAST